MEEEEREGGGRGRDSKRKDGNVFMRTTESQEITERIKGENFIRFGDFLPSFTSLIWAQHNRYESPSLSEGMGREQRQEAGKRSRRLTRIHTSFLH